MERLSYVGVPVGSSYQVINLKRQAEQPQPLSYLERLARYYTIVARDESTIEKLVDEEMYTYLKKLHSFISMEFRGHAIDLTYYKDEYTLKLLVNMHGSGDPDLDVEKFSKVSDQWFDEAPLSVTENLLLDVRYEDGREQGTMSMGRLAECMYNEGRMDDFKRCISDTALRNSYMMHYGII